MSKEREIANPALNMQGMCMYTQSLLPKDYDIKAEILMIGSVVEEFTNSKGRGAQPPLTLILVSVTKMFSTVSSPKYTPLLHIALRQKWGGGICSNIQLVYIYPLHTTQFVVTQS